VSAEPGGHTACYMPCCSRPEKTKTFAFSASVAYLTLRYWDRISVRSSVCL